MPMLLCHDHRLGCILRYLAQRETGPSSCSASRWRSGKTRTTGLAPGVFAAALLHVEVAATTAADTTAADTTAVGTTVAAAATIAGTTVAATGAVATTVAAATTVAMTGTAVTIVAGTVTTGAATTIATAAALPRAATAVPPCDAALLRAGVNRALLPRTSMLRDCKLVGVRVDICDVP